MVELAFVVYMKDNLKILTSMLEECPDIILALQAFDWIFLEYPSSNLYKKNVQIQCLDEVWEIRYKTKNRYIETAGFYTKEKMKKIIELAKSEKFKLLLNFI